MLTTGQFLELDYDSGPAGQPGAWRWPLRGDDPDSRPGEGSEWRPIDVSRDDHQARVMAGLPGITNVHADKLGYLYLADLAPLALHPAMISLQVHAPQPRSSGSSHGRIPSCWPASWGWTAPAASGY